MESIETSTPQKDDPKTHTQTPTNNKSKNHPRRFTDEQTRSLESIFKHETKLEPGRKLQIARDLCLEPKQVAIWFQNKRARWKSKRMEQEFRHLKSNYDALVVEVEGLKREKDSIQLQLKELNGRRLKNGSTGRGDGVIDGGDDGGIITRCGFGENEDEEFVRWSSSGEEEEMSNLSLFDEDFKWWET